MKRRNFLKNTTLGAAALASTVPAQALGKKAAPQNGARTFKMKFAPHIGMFENSAGKDPLDQLQFMYDQGFRAFEDNGMSGRDVELQKKMGDKMAKLGIEMGVFVAHKIYWTEPNLAGGKEDKREEFLNDIRNAVEVAKRVNAKWMTVVPGYQDFRQHKDFQTAHVVESLKRACDILEPHNLTMVLEPLNFRDHPGLFLSSAPQGYLVCKAVDSPACKVLFDIYHIQIQEGNIIPNIEKSWEEIGYFQIGDNPGRKEPTTGEINYKNVFKYIHDKGFTGILGMEHGNAQKGPEGEQALINAYVEVDSF